MKTNTVLATVLAQAASGLRVDFGNNDSKSYRSLDELQKQRVRAASRIATDRESFIANLRKNNFFAVPEFEITKIVDLNVDLRDVRPNDIDVDFLKMNRGFVTTESNQPITSVIKIENEALSIAPSVDVQCSAKTICVEFTKSYLAQHWHEDKWWGLHFSQLCNELHVYEDATTFKMCLGDENTSDFLNCGTNLNTNATHAVFSNHVTHFFPDRSSTAGLEVGTFGTQKIFEWKCTYPLQMVHSSEVRQWTKMKTATNNHLLLK
ncbi:Oidioi.mRNA.OKI2018_I69.chr2.g3993.t1.cds [Oikopleura dioica]|uniref:Oidioi.mRNA.OKI2018_I69.chr2.g3993.t1.cds n=1 Tax=Oikopleura dioica TaxID=34765 RepID=A0ABN7T2D7_OIKDI|nr:Oidioi.mRNA.OKI2018_I69.chr2.g3993.t1.cds [Oikopleura dioica]